MSIVILLHGLGTTLITKKAMIPLQNYMKMIRMTTWRINYTGDTEIKEGCVEYDLK